LARNRKGHRSGLYGRDVKTITNQRLPHISELLSPLPARQAIYRPPVLAPLPDNRRFYPRRFRHIRPTLTIRGERAAIRSTVNRRNLYVQKSFDVPREVLTCVRRSQRKEVMFATGRAGRKLNYRNVRRTRDSQISCR
jgi:hypothetical protein